jgi:hypothetical protein
MKIIYYLYEQISSAVISYKTHWYSERKETHLEYILFFYLGWIREMQGFFLLNFLHFNSKVKNKKYDIYNTTQLYYVSKPMAPDLGN